MTPLLSLFKEYTGKTSISGNVKKAYSDRQQSIDKKILKDYYRGI